ncbi:HotDog domain-containing protein [Coprinopsis sp. MPI-PUGE-AT-0042]|nr:HotDog domain-containing protein [Coprinopsis sp. MPI-PUGE-AT-0042]
MSLTVDNGVDISHIIGNAPDNVKRVVASSPKIFKQIPSQGPIFGEEIHKRMVVTEVSIIPKIEEPKKNEGRVVIEMEVAEDMLNGGGNIHGGCSAFLVDVCSTLALMALDIATTGKFNRSVSQSLNIVYHSPAALGDRIRIVNQTMTVGARAQSARTEIWNLTHHRLVSSGTHIKMVPSPPPVPKSNL